ncbi:MAG: hypothetical protein IJB19_02125 [Clostridia bacterium]|nr:hypothetical protein [Clostridia bacterium]
MKKVLKIAACLLLAGAFAFGAICVYAASYSSADDPLISLSYINEVLLPQVQDMIKDALSGVDIGDITTAPETTEVPETTEIPETTEQPPETTEPIPEVTFPAGTVNTGVTYVVVQLQAGQTLYASVNSCEVIVRAGGTTVVSPFTVKWEEQGVSDTTGGKELYNGETVPTNHTILIPRDDGRGITAGEGGAWLMVRGDYIIKGNEPAETTAAPVETTAAPVETKAAPAVTTAAPAETTAAPMETTAVPAVTTGAAE